MQNTVLTALFGRSSNEGLRVIKVKNTKEHDGSFEGSETFVGVGNWND